MKTCNACGEKLENGYAFCPIDGNSLAEIKDNRDREYSLTLISETSLARRIISEVESVIDEFRRIWPSVKAEPLTFARAQFTLLRYHVRQIVTRPYASTAALVAIGVVLSVILSALLLDRRRGSAAVVDEADGLVPTTMIDFRAEADAKSKSGIGTNDNGRVGLNKGHGEGSGPTPARSHGGGGGGDGSTNPASQGRLPQPSEIPASIPTIYARVLPQASEAGIFIDPALWKDLPFPNYGDPRSKSPVASNGPGELGGVGTGKGTGIGSGEDNGVGPGRKGNTGTGDNGPGCCGPGGSNDTNPNTDVDRVFRAPEVSTRARVISKPEPQYTEEARKAGTTGTVILSVVFSRTGQVTNIRAVQTLCCGLTEKAMAAARQIRFIPAMRNGQIVSTYMQLEYNFNLY